MKLKLFLANPISVLEQQDCWVVESLRFEFFYVADKEVTLQIQIILTSFFCLTDYRQLDMSFNILRKIEGLERLTRVKKLFLLHNKISNIGNLENCTVLEMLELGSNRIRVWQQGSLGQQEMFKLGKQYRTI